MSYATMYDAARTAAFLKILEIAMTAVAKDIVTEPSLTANHLNRVVLAQKVLQDPPNWVVAFRDGVAVQGVTDASQDSDFYSAVAAIWNGYAGVVWNGAAVG